MKRQVSWVCLLLLLVTILIPVGMALAAYNYSVSVRVFNNSATSYPNGLPVLVSMNSSQLYDYGYIDADGLNTNVQEGATDRTFMVDSVYLGVFIPSFSSGQVRNLSYRLGDSTGQTTFPIIPGVGGNVTVVDAAALEPGSDFGDEFGDTYVDTSVLGETILSKKGAYRVIVDSTTAGTVNAEIGSYAQVIQGGNASSAFTNNNYNVVMGGGMEASWDGTEANRYQVIPANGTISDLRIQTTAALGGGQTATFTLMVNGVASALTATVLAGGSTAVSTDGVSISAGDYVSLYCTTTGAASTNAYWSTLWVPDTVNQSITTLSAYTDAGSTLYALPQGIAKSALATGEQYFEVPVPTAGTFSKMYVKLSVDPGAAPDAYSFTLRVNTADTALTCTVAADATTGSDLTHSVAVVAGNVMAIKIAPLNGPAAAPQATIGMVFTPTVVAESIVLGGVTTNPTSTGATRYSYPVGGQIGAASWDATEANRSMLTQACEISKLYVKLEGAPDNGAGVQSYTLTLREAAGSTGITVTIAEAAETGNDVVNTYTSVDGALSSVECVPSGTPAATYVTWGYVSTLVPVTLTVAGVSVGEKSVIDVSLVGGTYAFTITPGGADSVAYAGSVKDNSSGYIVGGRAVSYIGSYKHIVSSVDQVWFEPNTMVTGSILTDRAGGDHNGTINWGVNPVGIEVTVGALTSEASTTSTSAEAAAPPDLLPDFPQDPVVPAPADAELVSMPMYPSVEKAADSLGMPVRVAYVIMMWITCMVMGVGGTVAFGSVWGFIGGYGFGNVLALGTPVWPQMLLVAVFMVLLFGVFLWRHN